MFLNDAKKLIKATFRTQVETGQRFSIELESGPGMGKSESVKQVAEELSREWGVPVGFTAEFLSTREPPDVAGFGLPSKDADGTPIMVRTKAPWMPKASDPQYGILLLDEFRQAGHDVQKPAAELLLNGAVGESKLPITWIVVACSNRERDRSGVQRELAFVTNRRLLIKVDPHLDTWVEWAETRGIHHIAVAFAKARPGLVFTDTVPEKPGPYCTPRVLVKLSYLLDSLPRDLLTEVASGYMGEGVGAEFMAFMRVVDELPSYEDICANPTNAKLPERPDASYAAMQMVASRIDDKTSAQAFTYLRRMGKEFQVAGVKAALRRAPALATAPGFGQWITEHKSLVFSAALMDKK